jgi:hypothetical protein
VTVPNLLEEAFARFDEMNSRDPRSDEVDGHLEPRELVYARRMSERLERFDAEAGDALRLAARAQHIARWQIPRTEYPPGRVGYRQWRTRLMRHHADLAGAILTEVGYAPEVVTKVSRLLRKEGLKRDPDVQTLEDVVCLVFLEYYFDEFAQEHDDAKLVDILARTWMKMSERGRSAALELPLSERALELIGKALESGGGGAG